MTGRPWPSPRFRIILLTESASTIPGWRTSWKKNGCFYQRSRMHSSMKNLPFTHSLNAILPQERLWEPNPWYAGSTAPRAWYRRQPLFRFWKKPALLYIWTSMYGKRSANGCAAGLTRVIPRFPFPLIFPVLIFSLQMFPNICWSLSIPTTFLPSLSRLRSQRVLMQRRTISSTKRSYVFVRPDF